MLNFDIKYFRLLVVFLFLVQFSFGQLSDFTLSVTHTNETCTANGSLTFSVANTTAGATIVYTIYQLPNLTTPIAVQNTTSFGGLVSATYRVIATQSLGNLSNSQQQDVTILNQIVPLSYNLSGNNEICGLDGKIIVNVQSGQAVQYEIFSGPVLRPLQTSNIFNGLVAGQYSVRVFDNCGEGVVQNFTIFLKENDLFIHHGNDNVIDCDTIAMEIQISHSSNSLYAYPLSIQYVVHPPGGGADIIYYKTITSGGQSYLYPVQEIILFPNQLYSVDVIITDACGDVFSANFFIDSDITPGLDWEQPECGLYDVSVLITLGATIISAPPAFTGTLPYVIPSIGGVLLANDLPPGTYTFSTIDVCGVVHNITFTLINSITPPSFYRAYGCELGYGSIGTINADLQSVIITSAPSTFNHALPFDVSFNINSAGDFYMNSFPAGSYVLQVTQTCGLVYTIPINLLGLYDNSSFNIIENCGSFDLEYTSTSTNSTETFYFLQKYNPINNNWFNPLNGVVYTGGILNSVNAIPLTNYPINYNFGYTGTFRIIERYKIYGNGIQFEYCSRVLQEFEFSGSPKINDVYSFLCSNGIYDVFVDADGAGPLIYRITQKDGLPFVVENSNSSVFLGLPAAVYNFQVEDICGNILNSSFEVPRPFELAISDDNLCNGLPSVLTLPNFSLFQYQWWKDNNTTTILSTTNVLQFPLFNTVTNEGVYHVRVKYLGNPNSCIDFVLDYTVGPNMDNPNAGQDGEITYCGNQGIVNLYSLLQGNYDLGGSWTEITNSGMLSGNLWNSSSVNPNIYHFKYRVNGLCGSFDEANVYITIKWAPQAPQAFVSPIVCDLQDLNLFASDIPNAIYNWTGPNGFVSNDQNPVINSISSAVNGTYTVSVSVNGCSSGISSVEVFVNNLPEFELESYCQNSNYKVIASPEDTTSTYNWTGPDNFSSTENPIVITNLNSGSYQVMVTNADGCSLTKSIEVPSTLCEIQNFISPNNDEFNNSFNLAGFDVEKFEVYNRWGRLVYHQNDYTNQWHGQNNEGGILPDSTYYYIIYLKSGITKHGWVYVVN